MVLRLAAIGFTLSWLLPAGDEPKQKVQVTKTERMDLVSSGTLRLENSIGELTVEGWDQPEVEITTIKSSKVAYGSRDRENASRKLDRVRITAERRGEDIVITTAFPRYRTMPPPLFWRGGGDFDLEYHIHVPRNARLVVDHDAGEVHVDHVSGAIDVTVLRGEITLSLPPEGQYDIHARSDLGSVTSDFPGRAKRRPWLLGHQFTGDPSAGSQKLRLRVGLGDIVILKMPNLWRPAPLGP